MNLDKQIVQQLAAATFAVHNKKSYLWIEFLGGAHERDVNIAQSTQIKQTVFAFLDEHVPEGKKLHILADASEINSPLQAIPELSRKNYQDIIDHPKVNRVAVAATGMLFRVIVNFFVSSIIRNKRVKFFTNRKDALAWLAHE
jgi:hypothetical protein